MKIWPQAHMNLTLYFPWQQGLSSISSDFLEHSKHKSWKSTVFIIVVIQKSQTVWMLPKSNLLSLSIILRL